MRKTLNEILVETAKTRYAQDHPDDKRLLRGGDYFVKLVWLLDDKGEYVVAYELQASTEGGLTLVEVPSDAIWDKDGNI